MKSDVTLVDSNLELTGETAAITAESSVLIQQMSGYVKLIDSKLELSGKGATISAEDHVWLRQRNGGPAVAVGEPPSESTDAMITVGKPNHCVTITGDKVYLRAVNYPGGTAPPLGGDVLSQNDAGHLVMNSQMFWGGVRIKGTLIADDVLIDLGDEAIPDPLGAIVDLRIAIGMIVELTRRVETLEEQIGRLSK